MALFINGVGQDTFSMNGVAIDNLYVDGVLVWSLSTENTKPVITILGDNPMQLIQYGPAYEEEGAQATDYEDGIITNDIVIGGDTPDVSTLGYYYVTYNVTDSQGLAADEKVRTVQVYTVTVPKYELTEALINDGTFDYVPDSNNPNSYFEGKLTESDGITPYEPTALQYPQNGLLELDNGRIMDTQFNPVTNRPAMYGIYGADGSTAYKIWAVEHTGFADIYNYYEGDQDTPLAYIDANSLFIPDESLKITDERPSWLPALGTELWDGNFADPTLFIDVGAPVSCTLPSSGSYHYISTEVDVSGVDTVEITRGFEGTQRYVYLWHQISDGLCYSIENTDTTFTLDVSNMDYLQFYLSFDSEGSIPTLSVKEI